MEETIQPRERLVAAAAELMHERGYTAVGVNDICVAADVKRGSFFHYFPAKRDIALAVLDRQWNFERTEIFEASFSKEYPPLDRIKKIFGASYEYQAAKRTQAGHMLGCPFGLLAAEMSTQDEVIRERLQEIFSEAAAYFADALAEISEQEDVPIDAETAELEDYPFPPHPEVD